MVSYKGCYNAAAKSINNYNIDVVVYDVDNNYLVYANDDVDFTGSMDDFKYLVWEGYMSNPPQNLICFFYKEKNDGTT